MLECLHAWSVNDAGGCSNIIYIDLRQVFDSECYKKLLFKLKILGNNEKLLFSLMTLLKYVIYLM